MTFRLIEERQTCSSRHFLRHGDTSGTSEFLRESSVGIATSGQLRSRVRSNIAVERHAYIVQLTRSTVFPTVGDCCQPHQTVLIVSARLSVNSERNIGQSESQNQMIQVMRHGETKTTEDYGVRTACGSVERSPRHGSTDMQRSDEVARDGCRCARSFSPVAYVDGLLLASRRRRSGHRSSPPSIHSVVLRYGHLRHIMAAHKLLNLHKRTWPLPMVGGDR